MTVVVVASVLIAFPVVVSLSAEVVSSAARAVATAEV